MQPMHQEMIDWLEAALRDGNKFAILQDFELPSEKFDFHFMRTAKEADRFCSENQWHRSGEGEMITKSYRFDAIENLLLEYRLMAGHPPPLLVSPASIPSLMLQHGIETDIYLPKAAEKEIAYGCIHPVKKERSLSPGTAIDRYCVVVHHHEYSGLIYELGHSAQIIESYDAFQKAAEHFNAELPALYKTADRISAELQIVGQFEGQQLRIDDEGHPVLNTGITLKSAEYSKQLQGTMTFDRDPNREIKIFQRFFVKYDATKQDLVFLNHTLHEFEPDRNIHSAFDANFHRSQKIGDWAQGQDFSTAPWIPAQSNATRAPNVDKGTPAKEAGKKTILKKWRFGRGR